MSRTPPSSEPDVSGGASSSSGRPRTLTAPALRFPGVDILRAIAVVAVVYSHISYYLVDDLGTPWWVIDVVSATLVNVGGLNQHLSFVGVAFFMMLTGLVATGSAMRNPTGSFLVARAARLLPVFWLSVLAAVVLVRLGVNGLFSGGNDLSNGQVAMSFVLGGFFVRPEIVVLGVTWTLSVQALFYLYCVAMRRVLLTRPVVVPTVGALVCLSVIVYTEFAPVDWTVPMLDKIAATLPAVFVGQLIYLAWAGLLTWRETVPAMAIQGGVVTYATVVDAFHVGQGRHVWTLVVLTATTVLLAKRDGPIARSRSVHWLATRSYTVYLVHTLVLYRVYSLVEPHLGPTAAVAVFLVVTGVISDLVYRYVETPASRWIVRVYADRTGRRRSRIEPQAT